MSKRPTVDVFDRTVSDDLPEGWLTEAEAKALADLATNKVVLEVGSWLGRSTIAMARTAKIVIAVDHHRGSKEHQEIAGQGAEAPGLRDPLTGEDSTLRRFLANLEAAGVREKVMPVVAPFEPIAPYLYGYELVFIDAQHDHNSVINDARQANCVRWGPMPTIVFHDYGTWPGVVSAVAVLQREWKTDFELLPGTTLAMLRRG